MRKSYIAKGAEALNLHNGKQTAIVVKMKLPKWCKRFELQGGRQKDPTCYSLVDLSDNNASDVNGEYLTLMDIAPYQIGQEVYVRETFWDGFELDEKDRVDETKPLTIYKADTNDTRPFDVSDSWCINEYGHDKRDWLSWSSAATMPKQAARTRFKIVGCEVVRVKEDMGHGNATKILEFDYSEGQQFKNYAADWNKYNNSQFQFGDYRDSWQSYIISRFGKSAWDNNDYIWYYRIEKI